MSIKYDPSKMLRQIMPAARVKRLLKRDLTVNRAVLAHVDAIPFIDRKEVTKTALKVATEYRKRVRAETATKSELKSDPAQLIQRVQNQVVLQISESIRANYEGQSYIWLPSDAEEPDELHQLNYGKRFVIGEGEQPGERWGCRCGMQILVKGSELNLNQGENPNE